MMMGGDVIVAVPVPTSSATASIRLAYEQRSCVSAHKQSQLCQRNSPTSRECRVRHCGVLLSVVFMTCLQAS
jgi:hypothetical protein